MSTATVTGPTGLARMCDALGRFIEAEVNDLKKKPVQYVFDLLPDPFNLHPHGPSNTHILKRAVVDYGAEKVRDMDELVDRIRGVGERGATLQDAQNCLSARGAYQTGTCFSGGAAAIGVVATIASLVAGLPGLAFLTGALTVGTGTGALLGIAAMHENARAGEMDAMRRENEVFRVNNDQYIAQNRISQANMHRLAAENVTLRQTQERITAEANNFRNENAALREARENLTAEVINFRNENVALRTTRDQLTAQVAQFTQQNERLGEFERDIRAAVADYRAGNRQFSEAFVNRLDEFTRQSEASRQLWAQIAQDAAAFRQDYALQINQLRELIRQLTERGLLHRFEENRMMSEQLQRISGELNQRQNQLTDLIGQVALRDGQVQERERVLIQLRNEHQAILDSYRALRDELRQASAANHSRLEAHMNRLGMLLGERPMPSSPSCEATVNYDVGYGNALAVRAEPNWNDNIPFSYTVSGWKGQLQIGREFKFVIVSRNGVRWETGSNRRLLDPASAQRHFITRPIVF